MAMLIFADMTMEIHMVRRALSSAQKREVIKDQLRETPEVSNRQIGKLLGVDDKTVGSVRAEMESTAEIPQFESTIGADGKERPRIDKRHNQDDDDDTLDPYEQALADQLGLEEPEPAPEPLRQNAPPQKALHRGCTVFIPWLYL